MTLDLSKISLTRAEPVTMTIRVKNNGATPVENTRPWYQTPNFWVEDATQKVIWNASYARRYADGWGTEMWLPGEDKTYSEAWDQRLCGNFGPPPSGHYVAKALWMAGDQSSDSNRVKSWRSNPVEFDIR